MNWNFLLNDWVDISYWFAILLSLYGIVLFVYEIFYKLKFGGKPSPIFICVLLLFISRLFDRGMALYSRCLADMVLLDPSYIIKRSQLLSSYTWAARDIIADIAMITILWVLTKRLFSNKSTNHKRRITDKVDNIGHSAKI